MLYNNVKALCENKGITVGRMEKALGFSNGSICKWNDNEPSISKVQKVATYLGVSIEELLSSGEKGYKKMKPMTQMKK